MRAFEKKFDDTILNVPVYEARSQKLATGEAVSGVQGVQPEAHKILYFFYKTNLISGLF